MHDNRPDPFNSGPGGAQPERGAIPASVPLSATRAPGDLTVLERLDAFRELIRHGNTLLGEVLVYCRDAEAALNQIAAEKQENDHVRSELEEARQRATSEANAVRDAMAQAETQRRELAEMRKELVAARAAVTTFEQTQAAAATGLEQRLREAKEQQARLEAELQRVQAQAASTRTLDAQLQQVDGMQAKLRATERELTETRRALESERGRRDRAIALIKPREVAGEARV
jgi:chromosome segregation ATPase